MTRVSACSFIVEKDDLWLRRIDRAFFYDAPRVDRARRGAALVCPGDPSLKVPLRSVPWIRDPACSGDPFVRVPRLEKEGIRAEIIFPTLSWALLSLAEPLRTACLRAYNSWIWNITTTSPRRFHAAAILPVGVEAAAELQRLAPMGIKAAIVPVESVSAEFDGLWGEAASLGIPLVMTRIGGATPFEDFARFAKDNAKLTRKAARAGRGARFLTFGKPGADDPRNIAYIGAGGKSKRELWGRLGAPAGPGNDEKGAAYFKLPA